MKKGHPKGIVQISLPPQFKGVWIPKELLLDDNLTVTEVLLLSVIKSLSEKRGFCYASSNYLAELIKSKGKTTVRNLITGLRKKGYIEDVPGTHHRRAIRPDASSYWEAIAV